MYPDTYFLLIYFDSFKLDTLIFLEIMKQATTTTVVHCMHRRINIKAKTSYLHSRLYESIILYW